MLLHFKYLLLFIYRLHGSYESLKGGTTCEAMEDFTGGVTEMHEMDKVDMSFFRTMQNSFNRGSLMGASIEVREFICHGIPL